MEPTQLLMGLAEVSIGLAGFAAIVLVLAQRSTEQARLAAATWIMRLMLLNSVGVAVGSIISVAIVASDEPGTESWHVAGRACLAVALLAVLPIAVWEQVRNRWNIPSRSLAGFTWVLGLISIAAFLASALNLTSLSPFSLVFAGLGLAFANACIQFMFLVYYLVLRPAT